jgi:ubiquinone/menaquinone biosynthesis C-methylase UbiE
MNLGSLLKRYQKHYSSLSETHSNLRAAELAVGGDFNTVGIIEYYVLKASGLREDMLLVDVGCGTGRLAYQLAQRGHKFYAGFDIVLSAAEHARQLCNKPDWTFGVTKGIHIDIPDGSVDMACFFSVFTHISHEHTYLYLKEMSRSLKTGGTVVFTFLEFAIPSHWTMFEAAVRNFQAETEPIVFLDRQALASFARYLNFDVVSIQDGDKPTVPLSEQVAWENGIIMKDHGNLGQSICVLRKSNRQN